MKNLKKKIQEKAYSLYLQRGKVPGCHFQDWFEAEKLINVEEFKKNLIWLGILTAGFVALWLFHLYVFGLNGFVIIEIILSLLYLLIKTHQIVNPERFFNFLTAIATIVIALVTALNYLISDKLERLENENIKHNKTALQVEFRPYVALQLQNPGKVFTLRPDSTLMPVTIESINNGKVPALDVDIFYEAAQKVPFDIKDANDIPPEGKYEYNPDINIGNPSKYNERDLIVILKAIYSGNYEVDLRRYCTESHLTFKKVQNGDGIGFQLKSSGSIFGFEKQGKCFSQNELSR